MMVFQLIVNGGKMSTSKETDVQNLEDAHSGGLTQMLSAPPMAQREEDYFNSYAQGKALQDWFEHEVITLTHLSKVSCIIDDTIEAVKHEGLTTINGAGSTIANPNIGTMRSLMSLELSAIKALRLATKEGREKPSKRRDVSKRAARFKQAGDVKFDKGNLLASPD